MNRLGSAQLVPEQILNSIRRQMTAHMLIRLGKTVSRGMERLAGEVLEVEMRTNLQLLDDEIAMPALQKAVVFVASPESDEVGMLVMLFGVRPRRIS